MKKVVRILAVAAATCALAAGMVGCGGGAAPASSKDSVDSGDQYATGVHHVSMQVEGYDPFTIEIDSHNAPITSSNFLNLVEEGFYDGLTFHRMIEGFCLQGGCPDGTGMGGSDESIKGEFSANGVENALADNYQRGVVAMARANDPDSASSQFFVTLSNEAAASLNGQYAAFGTVDDQGMAVVDQIVADYVGSANAQSGQISSKDDQPVITKVTVVD